MILVTVSADGLFTRCLNIRQAEVTVQTLKPATDHSLEKVRPGIRPLLQPEDGGEGTREEDSLYGGEGYHALS
ncbi:hypothetical protein FQN60_015524 [Etheostoma spectabile]|uniref:Uncharacterized protein n=1 Tax=Etheostoma spectabile TaxID=54343 RepID=A0A5J5CLW1_9PERO|nr:hypothetical protein FQN60_015524 [Etheostoma spectabile]